MAYNTPGVYIDEINAFGSSVVGVATAEPAFVGYTETARDPATGQPLDAPIQITSLIEFQAYFGGPAQVRFAVTSSLSATPAFTADMIMPGGTVISSGFDLTRAAPATGPNGFCLYPQIELFFANGGSTCWVMSAGRYDGPDATITASALIAAIDAVGHVIGPTMLVVPEACQLPQADYASVVCAMLGQAGTLRDRVAILDLPGCLEATDITALTTAQQNLWRAIAPQADHLSYGAAYAPALTTTLFDSTEVLLPMLAGSDNRTINTLLTTQAVALGLTGLQPAIAAAFPVDGVTDTTSVLSGDATQYPGPAGDFAVWQRQLDHALAQAFPIYREISRLAVAILNVQPPSGAIAGVWAGTDTQRGVWNAPANVAVVSVAGPLCRLTDTEQGGFNAPGNGMAVDILRVFTGRGTVVWGTRTLDGNSPDYRYIPVRRTLIYVEQSIKLALQQYVFAANDARTWATVVSVVSRFLTELWQQGGLMGARSSDAFTVRCGLGTTMTAQNMLDGELVVMVTLQMVRPAEFIVLTFKQALQKS